MSTPPSTHVAQSWQTIQQALPDFLIAGSFLFVWISPNLLSSIFSWLPGPELVGVFVFLMFFEFFFIAAFGPVAGLAYSKWPFKSKVIGLGLVVWDN